MVTGTKPEEDRSLDNINNLLISSTSVMIFCCVMEVILMNFNYLAVLTHKDARHCRALSKAQAKHHRQHLLLESFVRALRP